MGRISEAASSLAAERHRASGGPDQPAVKAAFERQAPDSAMLAPINQAIAARAQGLSSKDGITSVERTFHMHDRVDFITLAPFTQGMKYVLLLRARMDSKQGLRRAPRGFGTTADACSGNTPTRAPDARAARA